MQHLLRRDWRNITDVTHEALLTHQGQKKNHMKTCIFIAYSSLFLKTWVIRDIFVVGNCKGMNPHLRRIKPTSRLFSPQFGAACIPLKSLCCVINSVLIISYVKIEMKIMIKDLGPKSMLTTPLIKHTHVSAAYLRSHGNRKYSLFQFWTSFNFLLSVL